MSADLRRILVACRGEIAQRLIATYHTLGIEAVVAFSAAEPAAPYLEDADYDVYLGEGEGVWSDVGRVVSAAMDAGCDAVHPGYGEIARRAELYREATAANLAVIGLDPRRAEATLHRTEVYGTVGAMGFDVPPWGVVETDDGAMEVAARVGVPLLAVGRTGSGHRVDRFEQLPEVLAVLRAEGEGPVLLVHTVEGGTPVAVVVAGDRSGSVVPLGEIVGADVLELAIEDFHPGLGERSAAFARKLGFVGIGSVRYRVTGSTAWFVAFDPHLPVAYEIVERACGIDVLELQHALVTGGALGDAPSRVAHGVQVQVWAQGPGTVERFGTPQVEGVDVASVLVEGAALGAGADPLLAKLTTSGPDAVSARFQLQEALHGLWIEGVPTRLVELRQAFGSGGVES